VTVYVKTNKGTRYAVEDVLDGLLLVRHPSSGKKQLFGPRYVGQSRYNAAVHRFWREKRKAAAA